jgi:alkylated DNA repair protein alkB family protein 6
VRYLTEKANTHWIALSSRRVILYGVHFVADDKGQRCYTRVIPDLIQKLAEQLCADGYQTLLANHILVNEYRPGQGIMPHEDGPAFAPNAAIISLVSSTVLDLYCKNVADRSPPAASIRLPPRSLCLIADEAYTAYLHGIAERMDDAGETRGYRLSLTFRHLMLSSTAANREPSKERRFLNFLQRRG